MAATVTAEFSDALGTSTAFVDAYQGQAGAGWATAWAAAVATSNTLAGTVTNTSPLLGGGNYLSLTAAGNAGTKSATRRIDGAVIDLTQPYTVAWKFRLETSTASFNVFNDRVHIGADTASNAGTGTGNSWLVGVVGASSDTNTVFPGTWYFFDYNGSNTFNTGNMFDTGLALTQGRVYSFLIEVNPATRSYSAQIDDGVNPPVSAANLGFRNNSTAATPFLMFGGNTSENGESLGFSIDGVVVDQIPEPGAAGLLAAGGFGLAVLRRRRRMA